MSVNTVRWGLLYGQDRAADSSRFMLNEINNCTEKWTS
jgi:hypothetical protein